MAKKKKKTKTMDEEAAKGLGSEKALTMEVEVEVSSISSFKFHQLPFELLFDILSRLSIESLVTLRTVSKWWNNTLENQKLAHQLISVSLKDSSQNGILTMSYHDNSSSLKFSNNGERPKVIHDAPFESKDPDEFRFVNCCNGLICFSKEFGCTYQIFICNPVTKEVISLPSANGVMQHPFFVDYGFGFSPATEEYKVVRKSINPILFDKKPEVFTLGTSSSWRTIASHPIHPSYGKNIYANGALHWKSDTVDNIISFDIENEEFYLTKVPKVDSPMCEQRRACEWMDLIQVRGCLGVVIKSYVSGHLDIRVLKDKEWIKEYVLKVQLLSNLETSIRGSVAFRIIGLWQHGEIFIAWKKHYHGFCDPSNWVGYNFFSYDPKTDRRRDIRRIVEPKPPSTTITTVVCGYTMSLVSLKPYGYKKE